MMKCAIIIVVIVIVSIPSVLGRSWGCQRGITAPAISAVFQSPRYWGGPGDVVAIRSMIRTRMRFQSPRYWGGPGDEVYYLLTSIQYKFQSPRYWGGPGDLTDRPLYRSRWLCFNPLGIGAVLGIRKEDLRLMNARIKVSIPSVLGRSWGSRCRSRWLSLTRCFNPLGIGAVLGMILWN